MVLSSEQKRRADNLFFHLRKRPVEFFKEYEVEKCQNCKGTGLATINILGVDEGWDCKSYCDSCYGVGYQGLRNLPQIDDVTFICGNCNGVGCDYCENGITDWISHIMGR